MKKKIMAICLCVALVAVAVVGASLAYFTDTESKTNTFTVGNVKIELIESKLHRSNASGAKLLATPEAADKLVAADDYSKEHGWPNTYFPDEVIKEDAKSYDAYLKENGSNMVPGSSVHKMPYVINTGKNDAYVRVRVLVPKALFTIIDNAPSQWTTTAMDKGEVVSNAVNYYMAHGYKMSDDFVVTRGDVEYYSFDFTYTKALAPEEMTFWNCWGNIGLDKKATSDDLAAVDSFDVLVEADAIQAEGFDSATAAFAAFDAQG